MGEKERLGAFLDGEMAGEERAAFERRLAGEPALAEQAARLGRNDALLRAACAAPMAEKVPERFLALLGEAPGAAAPTGAANDNRFWALRRMGGLAAGLALGLLVGTQIPRGGTAAPLAASAGFADALSRTASGRPAAIEAAARLTPSLSFPARGGGYCREFDLETARGAQSGIACRRGGEWRVEALLPRVARPAAAGGFAVAAGAGDPALDSVMEGLRAGDPLDAGTEKALIARDWRSDNQGPYPSAE
jgi:hypothetical protein